MVNWAPLAAIARGVLLSDLLKKLSILRKINFFLKKKWKKFAHIGKMLYLCTRKTNKNNTTMKKQTLNRIFWAVVAIGLCTLVCVQWLSVGCGWQSLVMAAAFYCALCFGGYVVVDDILKERR